MKKRFAGIAALGMALTLAFGMTVAAAPSVSTGGVDDAVLGEVADKFEPAVEVDGITVTVQPATVEQQVQIENAVKSEAVQNQIETGLKSIGRKDVVTKAPIAVDFSISEEDKKVLEEKGSIEVPIKSTEVQNGRFYFVLHVRSDGNAELLGPVRAENGAVKVKFTSFSPVALIEVGEESTIDQNPGDSHWGEDAGTGTTASGAPASPKTGEVLPIAGFMAVICLAGAVVCVRKAHN